MDDTFRRMLIAAGQDPDRVAAEAAQIDLSAPTRYEQARQAGPAKGERKPGLIASLDEQITLDVGDAPGVVTIRPGTKKHESLAKLRAAGTPLETKDVEFLGEFKEAGLVLGGDTEGWRISPRGEAALGMLDYGSIATAEKGKPVVPSRDTIGADSEGKFQREGQSSTSRAAAVEATAITGKARLAVLACIHVKGGATDEEVEVALRMNPSTVRPRRVELVEAQAVEDSGERRKTASGRDAVVWRCTSVGAERAAQHLAALQART